MKQVSIYPLKVRFAYAIKHEKIENMFTGRMKLERVPTGKVHIFEFVKVDGAWSTLPTSFCGISHSQINESEQAYKESDKRPDGLEMCPDCEKEYKNDPRSPWYAFTKGQAVKVDA